MIRLKNEMASQRINLGAPKWQTRLGHGDRTSSPLGVAYETLSTVVKPTAPQGACRMHVRIFLKWRTMVNVYRRAMKIRGEK